MITVVIRDWPYVEYILQPDRQEALLPQTDRATRYVSQNLVNCSYSSPTCSAVFTCIGALGTPSRTGPHWLRQRGPGGPASPMAGQKEFFLLK